MAELLRTNAIDPPELTSRLVPTAIHLRHGLASLPRINCKHPPAEPIKHKISATHSTKLLSKSIKSR